MRRAVTFAVVEGEYQLLAGPDIPLPKQIADFKTIVGGSGIPGAERIEMWTSEGAKTAKFKIVAEIDKSKKAKD